MNCFTITPLNEGQDMNCYQNVKVRSRRAAIWAAYEIVKAIQSALPNCTISARVSHPDWPEGQHDLIVFRDGRAIDEATGGNIR
jgi:hypothetical protein